MIQRFRIPIWLTTFVVIIMILLFSLIIYNAREKEMVDQYNRQQMAIAKGIASGMENLMAGLEQNLKTLTTLPGSDGRGTGASNRLDLKFIFGALEGKAEFVALSNGKSFNTYPSRFENKVGGKLEAIIADIRKTGKTFMGYFPGPGRGEKGSESHQNGFILIAAPIMDSQHHASDVLVAGISPSDVIRKYIETVKYDLACDAWAIDDQGAILYHPNTSMISRNTSSIEGITPSSMTLRALMARESAGYGIFRFGDKEGSKRLLVAYAPIQSRTPPWFIAVSTPYYEATAQLKLTYYLILASAFFLIAAVVVASFFMVRSGKKRIRLEEELKHLRDKENLQERLLREKRMVDGIIEGSPIPMFVINKEHQVILWNKACADLTGYSSQEMIGTDNQYLAFYPEKRPILADLIVDLDDKGKDLFYGMVRYYGSKRAQKSMIVEGAYEAFDLFESVGGKQRHLYFLASPISDENGNVIAAIETIQDISREQEMSEALQDYNESLRNELDANINLRKSIESLYTFLQSIIKSSPDKIYALDSSGMVTYVSRGLGAPDSMQKEKKIHLTELIDPENKDLILQKWEDSKKGIFTPYEIEARARDGSKRDLLISVTPIKGTDNFIVVQRDITEFKNLEKKFYESQQLAALGQLSAGIAHEVRNPLSSIKMSLQILEKRLKPEGNDLKRFKIAEKEVEHLERLVSDILIYAKPDALDRRTSDLNAFVEHSLEKAEKEIADKHITVKLNLDAALCPAKFDSPKLGQALLNLYLNAIDAMETGGTLTVSTKGNALDGGKNKTVELTIEDTGCGIKEADIPYIFNPFFTKKSYGTGLGLTQVKKIVDLHQGTLEIFSKEAEGTRVVITLPTE